MVLSNKKYEIIEHIELQKLGRIYFLLLILIRMLGLKIEMNKTAN